jgi:hypothetical protein
MPEEKVEESTTQKLQNKVDKLKLLNLTSNIHNLNPPPQRPEEEQGREIALIRGLSVSPRITAIFLEILGLEFDVKEKTFIQVTEPIMNIKGAYLFCKKLKNISQETEWASFSEDEINSRIIHYFEEYYPYFTFWAEDYDLDPRNFGYVAATLQAFIDASFHKSKSGKFINTLGRTYSEDTLKKALETDNIKINKNAGFLERMNPFKEMK